jgi:hypothetical protein
MAVSCSRVREGLDRVAGHEPGGGQAVLLEKTDEARAADLAAEQAAGDIAGRVLAPVGAEHSGDSVHVDAERDLDVLSHEINLSLGFLLALCCCGAGFGVVGVRSPATQGKGFRDAGRRGAEAEQQAEEDQ